MERSTWHLGQRWQSDCQSNQEGAETGQLERSGSRPKPKGRG